MSTGRIIPTWRDPGPPPPPPPDPRRWRGTGIYATERRRIVERWLYVGTLVTLAVVLGLAAIFVLLWFRLPNTPRLVLVGAYYTENLAVPANPAGRGLLADLAQQAAPAGRHAWWNFGSLGAPRLAGSPANLTRSGAWDELLVSPRETAVMLVLAMHGGVDRQGPFLIPTDADITDLPANRLRFQAILDRLKELPNHQRKLLILDATAVPSVAPWGLLHNDFSRAVIDLEPQIAEVPNLVVILSTGPDQISAYSDDWARTAFGHFLVEGLRGVADRSRNGRLDALELFHFVAEQVENWSRNNRGILQTPLLLPRGAEGERRAKAIQVAGVGSGIRLADPAGLPEFAYPDDLHQLWSEYERRSRESLPAWAFAPEVWREYQATLLRVETLMLAGDSEGAAQVRERLIDVLTRLDSARTIPGARQLTNSLVVPYLAGLNALNLSQITGVLDLLERTPQADRLKIWIAARSSLPDDGTGGVLTRLRLGELLLARVALNPEAHLAPVADLINLITNDANRPIEAHFVAMLRRWLAEPAELRPPSALLQLAIRLRLNAERLPLGLPLIPNTEKAQLLVLPEAILPWLTEDLQSFDSLRREGEDLLFSTDKAAWAIAQEKLTAASRLAEAIQNRTTTLREAINLRDQAQMQLPGLAAWLSSRPRPKTLEAQREEENRLVQFERAAELTEILSESLARVGSPLPPTKELRELLQQFEKFYVDHWQDYFAARIRRSSAGEEVGDLTTVYAELAAARRIAWPNADLRRRLVTEQRRVSRVLLLSRLNNPTPISTDHARAVAAERARRAGRLALALLGKRYYDSESQPQDNSGELLFLLGGYVGEDDYFRSLRLAGEQVGQRWRRLVSQTDSLTRTIRQNVPANSAEDSTRLRSLAKLSRLLDGTTNSLLPTSPSGIVRRAGVSEVLLTLADRTWADHWYSLDLNSPPYFVNIGRELLTAAAAVRDTPRPESPMREIEKRLNAADPFPLALTTAERLAITSERRFSLTGTLKLEAVNFGAPGHAQFWLTPGVAVQRAGESTDARATRPITAAAAPLKFDLTSPVVDRAEMEPSGNPRRIAGDAQVHGLFRGRRLSLPVAADLYPVPDSVEQISPTPRAASLAVRTAPDVQAELGISNGGVAIVLDASGSMGPATEGGPSKFAEATEALKTVLERMPRGATVSVWAFGQAVGATRTVERAEDTIRRLRAPSAWSAEQLAPTLAAVRELRPWNESPIVRAILEAKADLANVAGFKSVVVITDGADNRFALDREKNPKKQPPALALAEAFNGSGIVVTVVGFKLEAKEEALFQSQFGAVTQFQPPGRVYLISDKVKLADTLAKAMRQRVRYSLVRDDRGILELPDGSNTVAADRTNDRWYPEPLNPGNYALATSAADLPAQPIALAAGDRLIVRLFRHPLMGLSFERVLYSSDFPGALTADANGWRLAVLQNQSVGGSGLQMLASLESLSERTGRTLRQVAPQTTWLELQGPEPVAVRWGAKPMYPAPMWSLSVANWPTDAGRRPVRPKLHAFWHPLATPPVIGQTSAREAGSRDVGTVTVESVTVENRYVEVPSGQREERMALVVRLRHPPGQPARATLPSGLLPYAEHRYYTQPSRTVSVFWREGGAITTNDVAQEVLAIESIAAWREQARRDGYVIEMNDLDIPDPASIRPEPIRRADAGIRQ